MGSSRTYRVQMVRYKDSDAPEPSAPNLNHQNNAPQTHQTHHQNYIFRNHHDNRTINSNDFNHSLLNSDYFWIIIIFILAVLYFKYSSLRLNRYFLGLTEEHIDRIHRQRNGNQRLSQVSLELVRTRFTKNSPEATLETEENENFCPICYEDFTLPVKTNCRHIFCSACIIICWKTTESRGGGMTTLSNLKCPMCRETVSLFVDSYT